MAVCSRRKRTKKRTPVKRASDAVRLAQASPAPLAPGAAVVFEQAGTGAKTFGYVWYAEHDKETARFHRTRSRWEFVRISVPRGHCVVMGMGIEKDIRFLSAIELSISMRHCPQPIGHIFPDPALLQRYCVDVRRLRKATRRERTVFDCDCNMRVKSTARRFVGNLPPPTMREMHTGLGRRTMANIF